MTKNSDYYKVLEYLQGFETDSDYQDIEHLLGKDKSYQVSAHYKRVIEQMVLDGLIEIQMGSGSNNLPGIYINGKQTDHSIDFSYRNLKGRITMKGLDRYREISQESLSDSLLGERGQKYHITNTHSNILKKEDKNDIKSYINPWPKRIFIVSIISLLFGFIKWLLGFI